MLPLSLLLLNWNYLFFLCLLFLLYFVFEKFFTIHTKLHPGNIGMWEGWSQVWSLLYIFGIKYIYIYIYLYIYIIGEMRSQFFIGVLLWVSCHCSHQVYYLLQIFYLPKINKNRNTEVCSTIPLSKKPLHIENS